MNAPQRPLSNRLLLQRPSSSSSPSSSRRAAATAPSLAMVSEGDEADGGDGMCAAAAATKMTEDGEEEHEEDEFQDCLTVIQVESSANVTIPTILTTAPSADDTTSTAAPAEAATSWRRLRGVLSATGSARAVAAEKQGLCPPRDEGEAAGMGAVRKRASTSSATGMKNRWKSMRSKTRDRYSSISDDVPEEGDAAEEEVLLRRVNAGVAGRKKRLHKKKPSLQRKNTIFGSRPRVERRLTSSTARGSSRMFYSFDEVTTDSDDDEDGEEVETVGGRGRRRQRQLRERVADDKVTRMRSLGNW